MSIADGKRYDFLNYQTAAEFRFKAFDIFNYVPTAFQERVHSSNTKTRVVAAAARVGKTWLAANEIKARLHYPVAQTIWCVGPTYEIARKVFREVWDYLQTPEMRKTHPMVIRKFDAMKIKLFNGTIIEGKSTDNEVSLLGEGVDLMVVDEASRVPDDVYTRYLQKRLSTSKTGGHLLLISTPFGINTMFHRLYLRGLDPDNKFYDSWNGTIHDSATVDEEAIEQAYADRELDPIGFQQEVLGKFVAHDGAVFPTFDENTFFSEVPYNPDLPVEATIDHGFSNPWACLFIQKNGQQIRIIDEYYVKGKNDIEHAKAIMPKFRQYDVKFCVVDPREPNTRGIMSLEIPSCRFVPGVAKEINLGIQLIRDHLLKDGVSERPFLIADKNKCKKLLWEFHRAHYRKGGSEDVADKDNHALSCLRYYLLLRANRLNRTDLSFFSTTKKSTESMFDTGEGKLMDGDLITRPWMGDSY